MSKVTIEGNASGTGTFTIAAPNSNTDRTLTLPDNAGTMLSSTSDLTPQVKTSTSATGDAPIFAARAWVNFNGTGTVAIRASGNVSSITDNGVGDYTVNFTTAMPDANYAVGGTGATTGVVQGFLSAPRAVAPTTNAVRVCSLNNSGAITDLSFVYVSVFR